MNNLFRRDFVRLTGITAGLLPLAGLKVLAVSGVPATPLHSLKDDSFYEVMLLHSGPEPAAGL